MTVRKATVLYSVGANWQQSASPSSPSAAAPAPGPSFLFRIFLGLLILFTLLLVFLLLPLSLLLLLLPATEPAIHSDFASLGSRGVGIEHNCVGKGAVASKLFLATAPLFVATVAFVG